MMIRVKTQNYGVSVTLWFTKHTAHLANTLCTKITYAWVSRIHHSKQFSGLTYS